MPDEDARFFHFRWGRGHAYLDRAHIYPIKGAVDFIIITKIQFRSHSILLVDPLKLGVGSFSNCRPSSLFLLDR